jgi:hypothetical protein
LVLQIASIPNSYSESNIMKLTPEQQQEIEQKSIVHFLRQSPRDSLKVQAADLIEALLASDKSALAGWHLVPNEPTLDAVFLPSIAGKNLVCRALSRFIRASRCCPGRSGSR